MVQDDEDSWEMFHSEMTVGELCAAEKWMSIFVRGVLLGETEE
jgi:hypothetical protein